MYYARGVDPTMLTALRSITEQQANPMDQTMQKLKQLLNYADTHPYAILAYHPRDIVLAGHSNAWYRSEENLEVEQGGGLFFCNNNEFPPNNGAVLKISKIIKKVMLSAAEAELGTLFISCKESIPSRKFQ